MSENVVKTSVGSLVVSENDAIELHLYAGASEIAFALSVNQAERLAILLQKAVNKTRGKVNQ